MLLLQAYCQLGDVFNTVPSPLISNAALFKRSNIDVSPVHLECQQFWAFAGRVIEMQALGDPGAAVTARDWFTSACLL
jgi:hypothetical protein